MTKQETWVSDSSYIDVEKSYNSYGIIIEEKDAKNNRTNYSYDNNWDLESDGIWTHKWDYNNRLIESSNLENQVSYVYDQSGDRVIKKSGDKTTYYINKYYDIEDGQVKKHIYAGKDKVASIDGTKLAFHNTDHLSGSSIETDLSGNILEAIDYYPFGSIRIDEQSTDYKNDYKFTGKELDSETDLYYYEARYYDHSIGRFISLDPWSGNLTDPQSLNKYSYTVNNPVKYNDPTGKLAETGWDLANVAYDLGRVVKNTVEQAGNGYAMAYATITGNIEMQDEIYNNNIKQEWSDLTDVGVDIAVDSAATLLPLVPAGLSKADDVADLAKRAKVVIGEDMKNRVIPKAKEIGADWYKPMKDTKNPELNQKKWIQKQMNENKTIVDIGRSPHRIEEGIPESKWYKIEKNEINKRDYQNIIKK